MQGQKLLQSIRLKGILSYGSRGADLDLEPLNVLIGPNASGKSNLIEAISLLAAAPRNLLKPFWDGGGVSEWLWKGDRRKDLAEVEAVLSFPSLRYRLAFTAIDGRFHLREEVLENDCGEEPFSYYAFRNGKAVIKFQDPATQDRMELDLQRGDLDLEQSILSQRKDRTAYSELTTVGERFGQIRFYRKWNFGLGSAIRELQRTDLPSDFLLEDGSNLALVLNDLQNRPLTKKLLLEKLKLFYERVEDFTTGVLGGTIQVFLHEKGLDNPVPASRLSDGTLRYLCLLAILCHPQPPPLICIEEPELGLHFDALRTVAELLVDAALKTQLIVTTHSDVLVSALSNVPECVVVCERGDDGTELRRLEPAKLQEWLDGRQLGDLWAMGQIGGTRW
ncbi:MAG TPA: AAA family ATPase [Thermoanaerobaculia bacterium]|nr:AAA family ATPase [Thermoanaerobaculia bacterium]